MRARIGIAAWVLGAAGCAGGDLATSSFGEGETDPFGTMSNDDDGETSIDPVSDDTTATTDDTTHPGTTTSGDEGPDAGSSSTDTGEDCSEEICDGIDNNCDDDVDEGCSCTDGASQSCYAGPDGTAGVGACLQGAQNCGLDGTWRECEGAVEPTTETCNDIDDDCDGDLDEDFEAESCGEGICQVTVETCVGGIVVECVPGPADPSESCNGEDDDCDGDIDEGCDCQDGDVQNCYAGPRGTENVGSCHGGTMTCADGAWGDCIGDVVPVGETCDGVDNDCDNVADENNPQGGGACNTGMVGVCAIGHQQCNAGALGCAADIGVSAEICDGLDNDCDSGTDEGNPGGGGACNTGLQGVCSAGTMSCNGGALHCSQITASSPEGCDNLDNDCDGSSDEGNPGGGQACFTGQLGVCAQGTTVCTAGAMNCAPVTPSSAEVCSNGLDEDCNGTADDGCPCAHGQCTPGGALVNGCSACVTAICATDPFCCSNEWDGLCVGRVWSECNTAACWVGCGHNLCVAGASLANNCDSGTSDCVSTICANDPFCCAMSWDAQCVEEVTEFCQIPC